jgi:hypothetical protein
MSSNEADAAPHFGPSAALDNRLVAMASDQSEVRHFVAHRILAWAVTFRGQDASHELLATGQALAVVGEDEVVKRSTAVRHLVEMGEEASDLLRLRDSDVGWPLEEIWVTGELLDSNGDLDAGSVILLLDVAPAELPWLAMHQAGEWVGERLRLGKRPMLWCYRPAVFPPWNARHRRAARVWAAATPGRATRGLPLARRGWADRDRGRPRVDQRLNRAGGFGSGVDAADLDEAALAGEAGEVAGLHRDDHEFGVAGEPSLARWDRQEASLGKSSNGSSNGRSVTRRYSQSLGDTGSRRERCYTNESGTKRDQPEQPPTNS